TGLEYDKTTRRLFAGCEKNLVVMNATNGEVVAHLPIGDGCDGVAFDNKNKIVFTSNGEGTITAVKENSADSYTVLGNYTTKRGARTITIDEKTGNLYLPTADFEPAPSGGGRSKMIPGTFQVLVVH
ncbi:MAG: YncE family protein, partial [Flavisolibacter sp.]